MSHLTNKERTLLQDLQSHEEICIQKYNNYANQTNDQQLQQIFQNLAQKEQNHYDTISQMLQGQVPDMSQGQQQGQQQQQQGQQQGTGQMAQSMGSGGQQSQGQSQQTMYQNNNNPMTNAMAQEKEASLCHDMLMTEKYVSSAYNTVVFEVTDPQIRKALQHIQQEEQQHGEELFNYMQANGMYQVN